MLESARTVYTDPGTSTAGRLGSDNVGVTRTVMHGPWDCNRLILGLKFAADERLLEC